MNFEKLHPLIILCCCLLVVAQGNITRNNKVETPKKTTTAAKKTLLNSTSKKTTPKTSESGNKSRKVTASYSNDVLIVNGISYSMIYVQGGTFRMGATSEQGSDVDSDEKPVHSVTLGNDYAPDDCDIILGLRLAFTQ